ncbi:putative ribonuclease H protein [Vitis vinifera]|uniref:Putative ribonuclease H protein n=1 Tax=Vitis vinifera TaxID=29760 RepID=A0A438EHJ0_VITVI|nr:putative ribonuclease H protein [Vitis vinifera]
MTICFPSLLTLSSLPTYFLFLFVIPKRVCARLEKIQRDFLWGRGALENRPHLVSWKIICVAKKDGSLGICSLAAFNMALLGKWLWRFANENDPLWKQIITRKYDLQEGGGAPKVKCFPKLFNLVVNKEGWVAEAWEEDGVGGSWGLCFNRHLNDWEVGEVESLLSKLHPLTFRIGVDDLLWWRENKNGNFSVKASFFGWEAVWSRLLTIDHLKRSGWNILNSEDFSFKFGNLHPCEAIEKGNLTEASKEVWKSLLECGWEVAIVPPSNYADFVSTMLLMTFSMNFSGNTQLASPSGSTECTPTCSLQQNKLPTTLSFGSFPYKERRRRGPWRPCKPRRKEREELYLGSVTLLPWKLC